MNLKNKVIDVEISEEISGNLQYHTDDLINTRTVYLVLGRLIDRRVKERVVYSYNCNTELNKTNMLSGKLYIKRVLK